MHGILSDGNNAAAGIVDDLDIFADLRGVGSDFRHAAAGPGYLGGDKLDEAQGFFHADPFSPLLTRKLSFSNILLYHIAHVNSNAEAESTSAASQLRSFLPAL